MSHPAHCAHPRSSSMRGTVHAVPDAASRICHAAARSLPPSCHSREYVDVHVSSAQHRLLSAAADCALSGQAGHTTRMPGWGRSCVRASVRLVHCAQCIVHSALCARLDGVLDSRTGSTQRIKGTHHTRQTLLCTRTSTGLAALRRNQADPGYPVLLPLSVSRGEGPLT